MRRRPPGRSRSWRWSATIRSRAVWWRASHGPVATRLESPSSTTSWLIELLKEAVPAISRIAVLWNPDHADPEFQETQRAASTLGVRLQSLEVRQPGDFDGAFDIATREHAEGRIIVSTRLLLQRRRPIVEFGTKNRII